MMYKIRYIIIVIIAISSSIAKAEVQEQHFFLTTTKDLGTINNSKDSIKVSFEYINKTGKTMVINDIKKSCGCMTIQYDKRPIKKNEKGHVNVTVDIKNSYKYLNKSLVVYTTGTEPIILKIKAKIKK